MDAAAGRAVTEADIPVLIFGHAGHPAIGRIRSKGSLLVQSDSAGWIEDFVPADGHRAAIVNGVAEHRPIVISKVPDRKAIHHPVAERVERLSSSSLWNALAAVAAGKVVIRHVDRRRRRERS